MNTHIKSRQRVKDQGEVFTQEREVKNILKLTQATHNIFWTFLEPACGNGNFLVEIVNQRLEYIKHNPSYRHPDRREFAILKMLSTIYGVDIAEDNIAECKDRIKDIVFKYVPKKSSKGFLLTMQEILDTNIQLGDMLNGKDRVFFVEYGFAVSENLSKSKIKRSVYSLVDMEAGKSIPIDKYELVKADDLKPIDLGKYKNMSDKSEQVELFNTEVSYV